MPVLGTNVIVGNLNDPNYIKRLRDLGVDVGQTGGGGGGTGGNPPNVYNYDPAYGGKYNVPDPAESVSKAVEANVAAMPQIEELLKKLDDINYKLTREQFVKGIPGYESKISQEGENIDKLLAGNVDYPSLARHAAELGIGQGTIGSPFLDIYKLKQAENEKLAKQMQGSQMLTGAAARMPRSPLPDATALMLTGNDVQTAELLQRIIASAPDPKAAAQNAMNAAAMGQLMQWLNQNGGGNPNKGYFNDGSWLWNTLPTGSNNTNTRPASTTPSPTTRTTTPTSTTPGWGETWQTGGNGEQYFYGSTGNVPSSYDQAWDTYDWTTGMYVDPVTGTYGYNDPNTGAFTPSGYDYNDLYDFYGGW